MLERKRSEEGIKLPFNKVLNRPPKIVKVGLEYDAKKKKSLNNDPLDLPKLDCELCTLELTGQLPRPLINIK